MAASRAKSGSLPENDRAECGNWTGEQGSTIPPLQLPAMHELPSLTTQLITPQLARAFDIPHDRPGSAGMASAFQAGRLGQQGLDFLMQYNQGLQSTQQQQQQQQGPGAQISQQAAQMAQLQNAGGYGGGMMNNDMQNRQGFGQQQQYSGFPGGAQDLYNPAYMMGQQMQQSMQQNGSGAAPYPLFQQPNMFGFDAREAMAAGYNLGHFQGSLQQQQQHAQQKEQQQQRDAQQQQDQHQEAAPGSTAQPAAKRAHPDTQADDGEDTLARALKRPRLVWTAKLHQRFVEAVEQLGLKVAVPKTIMQMMNVEGLTRENVASHLQKFRLQLKRENKLDDEGNLISPLKGVKLGGSEEEAHGSATSQDKDFGGTKGSSPSSREVVSSSGERQRSQSAVDPRDEAVVPNLMLLKEGKDLPPRMRAE